LPLSVISGSSGLLKVNSPSHGIFCCTVIRRSFLHQQEILYFSWVRSQDWFLSSPGEDWTIGLSLHHHGLHGASLYMELRFEPVRWLAGRLHDVSVMSWCHCLLGPRCMSLLSSPPSISSNSIYVPGNRNCTVYISDPLSSAFGKEF
jgi:hypothetical protein